MPASEGRAGNVCIWIIACLFFILILSGGTFLVLYITLPASPVTAWFPIAGLVLVGIPWLFWIMTCIYRSITLNISNLYESRPPNRIATVAPIGGGGGDGGGGGGGNATTPGGGNSPGGSPTSARRVRFGAATVLGSQEGAGDVSDRNVTPAPADAEPDGNNSTANSNYEGSSLNSHESERPLAFSMS
ncbi:neuronal PAS domain-containing protein 3-like [Dioscorea cayenensis subsp. rotundata]|uniref:Neuronal PAS domain-containing protein 3-like n=1 Tax=Dioscorea cayennensis subsp. rotundata TaxID=55577 RepID=A0AB40BE16_DIOCR|nr:neuronal PAS domain-containing protein 3-like [Dioscorea cayenensis subsp. rotundata]